MYASAEREAGRRHLVAAEAALARTRAQIRAAAGAVGTLAPQREIDAANAVLPVRLQRASDEVDDLGAGVLLPAYCDAAVLLASDEPVCAANAAIAAAYARRNTAAAAVAAVRAHLDAAMRGRKLHAAQADDARAALVDMALLRGWGVVGEFLQGGVSIAARALRRADQQAAATVAARSARNEHLTAAARHAAGLAAAAATKQRAAAWASGRAGAQCASAERLEAALELQPPAAVADDTAAKQAATSSSLRAQAARQARRLVLLREEVEALRSAAYTCLPTVDH